jgi:hypothetical protein
MDFLRIHLNPSSLQSAHICDSEDGLSGTSHASSNLQAVAKLVWTFLWRLSVRISKGTNDLLLEDYESSYIFNKKSNAVLLLVEKLKELYRPGNSKLLIFLQSVYPSKRKQFAENIGLWLS